MASYDILVPNPSRVELRYIANDSVSPHQNPPIPYDAIEMFENKLKNAGDACIIPGGKEWVLDLDRLKKNFPRFLRWIGLRD